MNRFRINDVRLDTAQTVFFARELEHIEAESLDPKYAKLEGLELVQVLPGIDPTDAQTTYRSFDQTGEARRSTGPADDAPTVNIFGTETTSYFQEYHLAFEYWVDEVRAAARYNRPLDRTKAQICRQGLARKLDKLIAYGDPDLSSIKGLANLSGTLTHSLPTDGTGTSALFSTKTPDQILRDLGDMVDKVPDSTAEIETPTRVVFPPQLMRYLRRTRVSSLNNTTLLQFIEQNLPEVEFRSWLRLKGAAGGAAGTAGTSRIMVYNPSVQNVRLLLPNPFEQMDPEHLGSGWKIKQRFKTGGVINPFPKSVLYCDGAI